MIVSRAETLRGLVTARAASRGAATSVADVCAVCVVTAAVTGAAVTASGKSAADPAGAAGHVMYVTDDLSEQIEELQLTLGEGPRIDALAGGLPVLVPDLGAGEMTARWPGFGPAARLAGTGAVFAFPLQIGAISVGALDLYRRQPGPLTARQVGDSLLLADAATMLLLDRPASPGSNGAAGGGPQADDEARAGPGGQPWDLGLHRAEVDQATGMLTEQLGVSIDEAFIRLRGYAYAHDRRLVDVARDLVARTLRLGPSDS